MKTYTVAVLGATGAVGQEMIKVLQERNFPVGKLVPLASARSAGKTVKFRGEDVTIQEAADTAFKGVDIVLGAAENDIAKKFAPAIVASGAVFVDNSSAFRLNPEVPLIVPEVNPEDVKNHKGIISNPNCSTIITVTAVTALNTIAPIRTMTASTYQAVSGAGAGGPIELMNEVEALREGEDLRAEGIFPPDRLQPDPPDRRRAVRRLHQRRNEDAERRPQDHAPTGAEGQLHLRPRSCCAQPLHFRQLPL